MKIAVGVKFKTRGAKGINIIERVTETLVYYRMEDGGLVIVEMVDFEYRVHPGNAIYYQPAPKKRKRRAGK